MKAAHKVELTEDQLEQLRRLEDLPDDQIDTSDAPEITDWTGAVRGRFYRPVKEQLTLRIDADLIDWFKSQGESPRGYQTRINDALRAYVTAKEAERR